MFDLILLAGGGLEKEFRSLYDVESKAYIPLAGKMMVEYVIKNIRECAFIKRIVFVAPSASVPASIRDDVDELAIGGGKIVDSLKSGFDSLNNPSEKIILVPCDAPLMKSDSITEFVKKCNDRKADIYYSYLARDDSEKEFPGLRHTYVRLKEGVFCGGSIIMISNDVIRACEGVFSRITSYRKNPFNLARLLGFFTIIRFISGILTVGEIEEKFSKLLGVSVAGIRVSYAGAGFNVDDCEALGTAEKYLEEIVKHLNA